MEMGSHQILSISNILETILLKACTFVSSGRLINLIIFYVSTVISQWELGALDQMIGLNAEDTLLWDNSRPSMIKVAHTG